jgi:hypothetical protein
MNSHAVRMKNMSNLHKRRVTEPQRRGRLGNLAVDGRSYSNSHESSAKFYGVDKKYQHMFWNTAVK